MDVNIVIFVAAVVVDGIGNIIEDWRGRVSQQIKLSI
jgi:hypothetical protein